MAGLFFWMPQRRATYTQTVQNKRQNRKTDTSSLVELKMKADNWHISHCRLTSSGSISLNSMPRPVQAMKWPLAGSSSSVTKNCQSCREPRRWQGGPSRYADGSCLTLPVIEANSRREEGEGEKDQSAFGGNILSSGQGGALYEHSISYTSIKP